MLLQLATWTLVLLAASSLGYGLVFFFSRGVPRPRSAPLDTFTAAWLGLAIAIGALEILSLITRIGIGCIVALGLAAVAGLPVAVPRLLRDMRRAARRTPVGFALVLGWIFVASLLVSIGANEPVGLGDTCSTHIQQVKWARDYGAVVGLGILNSKLAFDQSAHLLAALLDHGIWRDRSVRVAVPFFLWLALVEWAVVIARASRSDGDVRAKIFCALTLPFLIGKTHGIELPSFSGDLPMACVALALCVALLRLPWSPRTRLLFTLSRHRNEALAIAAIAAMLVTIKLTGAMLVFLGLAVALLASLRDRRSLALVMVIPGVLIVGMLARRAVLSGWLLFPMPIGNLHLPWSIAKRETLDQYAWIRSWARLPDHSPAEIAARGFWFWFIPWFEDFRRLPEMTIAFVGAALATARCSGSLRRRAPITPLEAGLTASLALSIAYWFIGAPDPRFGAVFIWMFAAVAAVPLLSFGYATHPGPRLALVGVALAALLTTTGGWLTLRRPVELFTTEPVRINFPTVPFTIENGSVPLEVYVPSSGRAYCGDSPLPCTPFPERQRLRHPGVLGGGFLP